MNDAADHTRRVCYVASNELVKVSSLLPSNRNRSLLVHSLVKEFGLLNSHSSHDNSSAKPLRPSPADLKELSVYHDRDYLDHLLNGVVKRSPDQGKDTEYGLEEDCPSFTHLPEYVRLVAGASLSAARALRENQADIAICWDGGRHHAQKSQASGFCYVADCVLAILALKRALPPNVAGVTPTSKPRVMYLDLDLHFSDGVSQAFYTPSAATSPPPQVLTLSIHHAAPGFFPPSALAALSDPERADFDPFTLSLPLERGAANRTFRRVWRHVERVRDAFAPDYVVVQCGVDGLAGDPYATWNWALGPAVPAEEVQDEGMGESESVRKGEGSIGWCIARVCRWGCKTLLLGGGGYNSPNVARAWTYLTSVALGRPLALDADIPDHAAFPLYAPSFTLDVPAGNIQDQNTDGYLAHVENVFDRIVEVISARMELALSDASSRTGLS